MHAKGAIWQAILAWLPALAIAAMIAIVYIPAYRAGFVWDDDKHFTQNLQMAGPLSKIWTQNEYYYPLTTTVWWFVRRVWALNPVPYHLLNVLLHAVNAILLWRLLLRIGVPGAWLAAAVWGVHPVNVQSTAWATELKNCLSGAFYLTSLIAWTRSDSGPNRRSWYGAALGAFVLALLSKTSTVTLPFALVFIELWRGRPSLKNDYVRLIPFFAVAAAAGLWTILGHATMVAGPDWDLTPAQRLAMSGRCVWFYLGKFFWPANLSFVYPRWSESAAHFADWLPLAGLVVLATGLAAFRRRGGWAALLALGYFVFSLLPVLNLFRMYFTLYSYVADHWQYLAGMGGAAWAIGAAATLAKRTMGARNYFRFGALAGGALLAAAGALTMRQAENYRSESTLWLSVLDRNPGAWIAYNNLAQLDASKGRNEPALEELRKALTLTESKKALSTIRFNIALVDNKLARFQDALTQFRTLQDSTGGMELNLAQTCEKLGRDGEAERLYREVLAGTHRPTALLPFGVHLMRTGKRDEAIGLFKEYVESNPEDANGRMMLADAYAADDRMAEAVAAAKPALELARKQGNQRLAALIQQRLDSAGAAPKP